MIDKPKRKPKTMTVHRDGYRLVFWLEGKGRDALCCVDAYKQVGFAPHPATEPVYETEPCLTWQFGKVPGNNLIGNVAIWTEQALMYAKNPPKKSN